MFSRRSVALVKSKWMTVVSSVISPCIQALLESRAMKLSRAVLRRITEPVKRKRAKFRAIAYGREPRTVQVIILLTWLMAFFSLQITSRLAYTTFWAGSDAFTGLAQVSMQVAVILLASIFARSVKKAEVSINRRRT